MISAVGLEFVVGLTIKNIVLLVVFSCSLVRPVLQT